jgi:hypothetical protein
MCTRKVNKEINLEFMLNSLQAKGVPELRQQSDEKPDLY